MALIDLTDIHKEYSLGAERVFALRGVSLRVETGDFVAVMGASGSGKSTLMNILGCLDRPTRGTYRLEGVRVDALERRQLADLRNQKIGFVFQGFNLLSRTSAIDNVELPLLYNRTKKRKDSRKLARAALERMSLGDRLHHEPSQLSGGQQQRVAIARALVNDPALVLADEPTGNLDSRTAAEVMEIFKGLNAQGITIVVVTHESDIAAWTKRVVTLRDGLIVQGSPSSPAMPAVAAPAAAPGNAPPAMPAG